MPVRLSTLAMLAMLASLGQVDPIAADTQTRVAARVQNTDLRHADLSVMALDVATGREVAAISADQPMIPASNMKLLTTAAALALLGPDFHFQTELALVLPSDWPKGPASGTALIIRGDGDPALGDPQILQQHDLDLEAFLDSWVRAVRQAGVKKIDRLIVDDRVFDRQWVHPSWPVDQLHEWYCAPVSGLNFYDNCFDVYAEAGATGDNPRVLVFPRSNLINQINRASSGGADTFWVSRKPEANDLIFMGKVKSKSIGPVNVTMHDPAMFFARLLAERLTAAGLAVAAVDRPADDVALPRGRTLLSVRSSLPVVLDRCNKNSQNLFAEALLKRVGRRLTGTPGSWESGASAVRLFLRDAFANARLDTRTAVVQVADGSGLSRDNRVTARVLAELLRIMYRHPTLGPTYVTSLSVAGEDGTLRRRLSNVRSTVYGKSGSIAGVNSLSGYLFFDDPAMSAAATPGQPRPVPGSPQWRGGVIAFSFIANVRQTPGKPRPYFDAGKVRDLQEDLLGILESELAPKPAPQN